MLIFQAEGCSVGVFFATFPFLALEEVARVELDARFLGVEFKDSAGRWIFQGCGQSVFAGLIS